MTRRFGIDTFILVRLLTGEPAAEFEYCVAKLTGLVQDSAAEIFASNQVIGEAYVAVQHHYGVSKADARSGLIDVLHSGSVAAPISSLVAGALADATDARAIFAVMAVMVVVALALLPFVRRPSEPAATPVPAGALAAEARDEG